MATTLYNHNTLGTERKPLIPNIDFKRLHESLIAGEVELYERIIEVYTLESFQRHIVEPLYKKLRDVK